MVQEGAAALTFGPPKSICSYNVAQAKGCVMAAAEVVRARIDAGLKKEATAVLSGMGLSVSDAIRMMLMRVAAERALPFELREPNPKTREALLAAERGELERFESVADLMMDLNDEEEGGGA
jgi:DNA-damage-inducible protein J